MAAYIYLLVVVHGAEDDGDVYGKQINHEPTLFYLIFGSYAIKMKYCKSTLC